METSAVVFGFGKMGSAWGTALHEEGVHIETVVDPDPKAEEELELLDAPVVDPAQFEPGSADIWCIATPPGTHGEYVEQGINEGIPTILVEKPATTSPGETRALADKAAESESAVYVDYIELKHPAYRTVRDALSEDFSLTKAFHWRGKEPRHLYPYVRNDLIHDFSELYGYYRDEPTRDFDFDVGCLTQFGTWAERTNRFNGRDERTRFDVSANAALHGSEGERIVVKGGFDQPNERRYFVWVDESRDEAYFASTLNREYITPIALRVTGSDATTLFCRAAGGQILDDGDIDALVDDTDADVLFRGSAPEELNGIPNALATGEVEEYTTLSDAAVIEAAARDIYRTRSGVNVYGDREEKEE